MQSQSRDQLEDLGGQDVLLPTIVLYLLCREQTQHKYAEVDNITN
jgi:hypothetical protein